MAPVASMAAFCCWPQPWAYRCQFAWRPCVWICGTVHGCIGPRLHSWRMQVTLWRWRRQVTLWLCVATPCTDLLLQKRTVIVFQRWTGRFLERLSCEETYPVVGQMLLSCFTSKFHDMGCWCVVLRVCAATSYSISPKPSWCPITLWHITCLIVVIASPQIQITSKKNAMDRFALSCSICVMGEAISHL